MPHFTVVTGASTGIGRELALLCAGAGHDLLVVADEPQIHDAAAMLRARGAAVEALEADLASEAGVAALCAAIGARDVDLLVANAGIGLGRGFLDQSPEDFRRVIDTNVTGTLLLVHDTGRRMRARGQGRILIVGSIAGYIPGPFEAVYNGSKAFITSFALALREELRGTGVSVTCLMPGITDTDYFRRAGLLDTRVGRSRNKDSAAMVAKTGFRAAMRRKASVVSGLKNRIEVGIMNFLPATFLSRQHRRWTEPASDTRQN